MRWPRNEPVVFSPFRLEEFAMLSHRRLRPGRAPGPTIGGKPAFQTGRAGILPAFNFSGARSDLLRIS